MAEIHKVHRITPVGCALVMRVLQTQPMVTLRRLYPAFWATWVPLQADSALTGKRSRPIFPAPASLVHRVAICKNHWAWQPKRDRNLEGLWGLPKTGISPPMLQKCNARTAFAYFLSFSVAFFSFFPCPCSLLCGSCVCETSATSTETQLNCRCEQNGVCCSPRTVESLKPRPSLSPTTWQSLSLPSTVVLPKIEAHPSLSRLYVAACTVTSPDVFEMQVLLE